MIQVLGTNTQQQLANNAYEFVDYEVLHDHRVLQSSKLSPACRGENGQITGTICFAVEGNDENIFHILQYTGVWEKNCMSHEIMIWIEQNLLQQ